MVNLPGKSGSFWIKINPYHILLQKIDGFFQATYENESGGLTSTVSVNMPDMDPCWEFAT